VLRQRVLTAALLLPPAVAAVLWLPPPALAVVFAAIGVLAAWEWAALSGLEERPARAGYAAVTAVAELLLLAAIGIFGAGTAPGCDAACTAGNLRGVLIADVAWWALALSWILRYPAGFSPQRPAPRLRAALGLLVIPAAIAGLLAIRVSSLGRGGLLTVFSLVWAADIGAYFAGRALGKRKLAPQVSPGKSWEGFFGGLLAALAVGAVAGQLLLAAPRPWGGWLLLSAGVAAISVVGDLTESLLKRLVGVKDSGTLLPGHGGVLDRIDSLLAAAPAMALGIALLGL
jgi:phosphatidate cytidylyltransferase